MSVAPTPRISFEDWLLSAFDDLSDTVPLAAIDAALALAEIHDKVDFPVSGADG
jgi:hypothetical protein